MYATGKSLDVIFSRNIIFIQKYLSNFFLIDIIIRFFENEILSSFEDIIIAQ